MTDIESRMNEIASYGRMDDILDFKRLGFEVTDEVSNIIIRRFMSREDDFAKLSRWLELGYTLIEDDVHDAYERYIDTLIRGNYFPITTYMRPIIELYDITGIAPKIPENIDKIYDKIIYGWKNFEWSSGVEIYQKFTELFGKVPEELWYQEFEEYINEFRNDTGKHTCRELLSCIHMILKLSGNIYTLSDEEKDMIGQIWGEYGDDIFRYPFQDIQRELLSYLSITKKNVTYNPDEFIEMVKGGNTVYDLQTLYDKYKTKPEIYFDDIRERIIREIEHGNFANARWLESIMEDEIPWDEVKDIIKRGVSVNGN